MSSGVPRVRARPAALRSTARAAATPAVRAVTAEIRQAARRKGRLTLKDYRLLLLPEGLTSVEEVLQCVVVQE